MKSDEYKKWVDSLKEGDLVLSIEGNWSAPVIFLSWNGASATNGHRAHHLYIPNWTIDDYFYRQEEDPQKALDDQWKSTFKELENHGAKSRRFDICTVNANAEERYFPFPSRLLSKNQKKFVKLINKIKNYEY